MRAGLYFMKKSERTPRAKYVMRWVRWVVMRQVLS